MELTDTIDYEDYPFPTKYEWSGHWQDYPHEFHDSDSVQLGELVQAGWFDLSDKETWAWPKYTDEQDDTLRNKIVNRFWNRGLGILPAGMWKRQFLERMNEIMPKYIALYRVLEQDPQLLGASSEYYKSRNIFSDYPQTQLGGNSDFASTGNDTEYERIRQLDILDFAERLKAYRDVDVLIMDEIEDLFSCLISVSINTR